MSQAFIRCPNSEQYIYVGLNLEWADMDMLQIGEQETECPVCGETHVWTKADLLLRSDGAG